MKFLIAAVAGVALLAAGGVAYMAISGKSYMGSPFGDAKTGKAKYGEFTWTWTVFKKGSEYFSTLRLPTMSGQFGKAIDLGPFDDAEAAHAASESKAKEDAENSGIDVA